MIHVKMPANGVSLTQMILPGMVGVGWWAGVLVAWR